MKVFYIAWVLITLYINYNNTEEVFFPDEYGGFIYD